MIRHTKAAFRAVSSLLLVITLTACAEPSTTASSEADSARPVAQPNEDTSERQLVLGQDNPWGPNLGSKLVEIQAQDHTGRARTLADLSGRKGLLLMLVRSADW